MLRLWLRLALPASLSALAFAQSTFEQHITAARAAEVSGRFAAAEREYEQALALRSDPQLWQRLGLARHMQNKFAEAVPAFEKAVAGDPKLWGSHLFLGIDLYRTNQFRRAQEHLATADRLNPNQGETLFWLGATHVALKDYVPGLQALEKSLRLEPRNTETIRVLARGYLEAGTLLWNQVGETAPDSPAGLDVHGHALEFNGSYADAAETYRELLRLAPGRPGVRVSLARVLLAEGKSAEAVPLLQAELARHPESPEACQQLASALVALQRQAEAEPCLKVAERWGLLQRR